MNGGMPGAGLFNNQAERIAAMGQDARFLQALGTEASGRGVVKSA